MKINWEQVNNQEPLTDRATEDKRLIREWSDCDKATNSSQSGWIATNFTKEQLTKYKNEYKHRQRSGIG